MTCDYKAWANFLTELKSITFKNHSNLKAHMWNTLQIIFEIVINLSLDKYKGFLLSFFLKLFR